MTARVTDLPVRSIVVAFRHSTRSVAQFGDVAAAKNDRLVFFRRGARAVDHADVRQRDDGGVDLDEAAHGWKLRRLGEDRRRGHQRATRTTDFIRWMLT
jgi:hypothetical protein